MSDPRIERMLADDLQLAFPDAADQDVRQMAVDFADTANRAVDDDNVNRQEAIRMAQLILNTLGRGETSSRTLAGHSTPSPNPGSSLKAEDTDEPGLGRDEHVRAGHVRALTVSQPEVQRANR